MRARGQKHMRGSWEREPKAGNIVEFKTSRCQWICVELIPKGETTAGKAEGLVLHGSATV